MNELGRSSGFDGAVVAVLMVEGADSLSQVYMIRIRTCPPGLGIGEGAFPRIPPSLCSGSILGYFSSSLREEKAHVVVCRHSTSKWGSTALFSFLPPGGNAR